MVKMSQYKKRKIAIRVADSINSIEGVPVSENAKKLSQEWAKGEITADQMKKILLSQYVKA